MGSALLALQKVLIPKLQSSKFGLLGVLNAAALRQVQ